MACHLQAWMPQLGCVLSASADATYAIACRARPPPHHLCRLLRPHPPSRPRLAGLQPQQRAAEALPLAQLEPNLRVGVEAKRQGGLRGHGLVNVVKHLGGWRGGGGEEEGGSRCQGVARGRAGQGRAARKGPGHVANRAQGGTWGQPSGPRCLARPPPPAALDPPASGSCCWGVWGTPETFPPPPAGAR